jgi:hypothetical protein
MCPQGFADNLLTATGFVCMRVEGYRGLERLRQAMRQIKEELRRRVRVIHLRKSRRPESVCEKTLLRSALHALSR